MKYNYALLSAMASAVSAHTWIEQLMVIAPNGTLTGQPGFARGNVKRGTPGFGDPAMVNLIPGNGRAINQILPTDLMCKDTQKTQTQTDDSPRLQASAGDNIALRYQENGHVSLPQNQPGKPDNRGTIFVYGTTQPSDSDTFLSIHRVWNAEGTGGDGRGVLLSTQNYDDGQCYQVNGGQISTTRQKTFAHAANQLMGADLWCQQDIQIPTTAPSGKPYTLYWVWDWPTLPGTAGFPDGKQEIYTTCMDVDVTSAGSQGGNGDANGGSQNKAAGNSFVKGQDFGNAGIASQLADVANPTAVTGQFIPFSGVSGSPSPTDNSGKSTAQPQISTSSQSSGFTSYFTETATGAPTAATTPAGSQPSANQPPANQSPTDQPTANQGQTFTRTRHSRPSVSPIGPPGSNPSNSGNPGFGPGNNGNPNFGGNNNGNNGNPNSAPDSDNNQPTPDANASANLNTATAISNAVETPNPTPAPTQPQGQGQGQGQAGGAATVTQLSSVFQTVTQTKMETVFISTSAGQQQRRAEATSVRACSRTELAYRLRARKPFYIVPGADDSEC